MKTVLLCLALLIPSILSAEPLSNTAQDAQETALPAQTIEKKPVEVIELFSIYCAACFYWEQNLVPGIEKTLKENNIIFKQVNIPFMGRFANEASTALAITQGTPLFDRVKAALFKRIQIDRKGDWPSQAEFFKTLEQAGLSKKEYDQHKMSPVVTKRLADWNMYARSINAVPAFLLDGKYLINIQGVRTPEDFMERLDSTFEMHLQPSSTPDNPNDLWH